MKLSINLKYAAILALVLSLPVIAQEAKPNLSNLVWIAGCWEISKPEKKMLISEHWMSPVGDAMIGMSRTMRNGKMGGFEFLRIVQDDTGINYISKPSQNKEETAFKLVKSSTTEAVFENLAHDFPQRIIYRNDKPDSLFARIEGTQNGKLSGMDIPMKRAKCE